jgi:DMSO/TMAO reductase YedYZ molybdopterin-dependent catalytic subunit
MLDARKPKGKLNLMRRPSLLLGAMLGGLTSLPLIALAYLGEQLAHLPFVPFDLFDWLARVLPGSVIRTGIDTIVRLITLLGQGPISSTAKNIEHLEGIMLVIIGGVLTGLVMALVIQRSKWQGSNVGLVASLVVFLFAVAIEVSLKAPIATNPVMALLWLMLLIVGWGTLLGVWLGSKEMKETTAVMTPEARISRRTFLIKVAGGSIGVALAAGGIGRLLETQTEASGASQELSQLRSPLSTPTAPAGSVPTPGGSPQISAAPTVPAVTPEWADAAPGTRPEVTPNGDFYRIDIDALPPVIQKASWKLQVTGLFDRPRALTLSDLLAYRAVTQPITQSCISNPIGGDLIGTTNYTGARLRDVLQDLGLRPEAKALTVQAADGFYESVEMRDMLDSRTLLVYGMNGETLPVEHGFPLRIYIPNRYGMKQPKWITSIEAIDHSGPGYWVDRGWSAEAHPQILSVIDAVAKDHVINGHAPIGGIAWAGDRGISKVEVQVDDGAWAEAILQTPPLSPLTWALWRYDWPVVPGRHVFQVRATDGAGALQSAEEHDTFPDGATGYDSTTVTI